MATEDVRSLLVEADSFISHMRHRGSWPGDEFEVDQLIGRLRHASEEEPFDIGRCPACQSVDQPGATHLLGCPNAPADPPEVEQIACDLLGALRPWQLQPDAVRQACFRLTVALAARGSRPD